ncbi:psuG [Fragariocoptes setiger]|uniref:PsuG n=1 Tax=Fragariocoptes setiger TaxID=1670756 RepID=A0ABQ7S7R6_9ACAR|nr:psuG [Fragariocoptes setiger]
MTMLRMFNNRHLLTNTMANQSAAGMRFNLVASSTLSLFYKQAPGRGTIIRDFNGGSIRMKSHWKNLGLTHHKLSVGDCVRDAIDKNQPVVALESTVITHGMPYPQNLHLALKLEQTIRDSNRQQSEQIVPATIGIIDGCMTIGLTPHEIEYLASFERSKPMKASRRDIPYALSRNMSAGTTVSATMAIASLLKFGTNNRQKISVFATGGTGGVHVNGNMDISADLTELARTPIGVVSSGFKSFLDINRTLEYLETLGVPVITIGQKLFPSFYNAANNMNIDSPASVENIDQVASVLFECLNNPISSTGGVLIANPVPLEFSIDDIDSILERVNKEAHDKKIHGKQLTPYILKRLNELTNDRTLTTNSVLLENNARTAAEIALLYNRRLTEMAPTDSDISGKTVYCAPTGMGFRKDKTVDQSPNPVVVGLTMVDFQATATFDNKPKTFFEEQELSGDDACEADKPFTGCCSDSHCEWSSRFNI